MRQGAGWSSGRTPPSAAASPRCPSRSRWARQRWSGTSSTGCAASTGRWSPSTSAGSSAPRARRRRVARSVGTARRFGPTLDTGWKGPGSGARRRTRSSSERSLTASTTCTRGWPRARASIMALPHIGSWEYGGAFLATQGLPMTAVAERLEPPELFDYFVEQRAAMGLTIVPLDHRSGGHPDDHPAQRGPGRPPVRPGHRAEPASRSSSSARRPPCRPGPATLALRSGAVAGHRRGLQRTGTRPPGGRGAAARHHPDRHPACRRRPADPGDRHPARRASSGVPPNSGTSSSRCGWSTGR